jgi:uncharacterized protein
MIDGLCIRAVEAPLEITGDGRTVTGLLAPYNEVVLVDDGFGPYYETFVPGCFDRAMRGNATYLRVQLEHNGHWVGRGNQWINRPEGLSAQMRLDNTEAGREAAFKIHDGQTPGLSIAFQTNPNDRSEPNFRNGLPLVKRTKVKSIHHVALCQHPAYKGAMVESVRHASAPATPERLAYWKEWTDRIRRD